MSKDIKKEKIPIPDTSLLPSQHIKETILLRTKIEEQCKGKYEKLCVEIKI